MNILRPFPGLVVDSSWAERVTAGPYDSYTPDERAHLSETNPYNFLNVTRSLEDVSESRRNDIADLLTECTVAVQRLYDVGAYQTFDDPVVFLYQLKVELPSGVHIQTGIVGLVPVVDKDDPRILRHEEVRSDRVDFMAQHRLVVGVSPGPISLAYRSDLSLEDEVSQCCTGDPVLSLTTEGAQQKVWVVNGVKADRLISILGSRTLYVTDGHHRLEAATEALRRSENTTGPLSWIQAVLFPEHEMLVMPFHRCVKDPYGRPADELLKVLKKIGLLTERAGSEFARPKKSGEVGVYLSKKWYSLDLPKAAGSRIVDQLDVSRLQSGIFSKVFKVADLLDNQMIDYVPDTVGLEVFTRRCDSESRVGFVMHPMSVAGLMRVADAGELMPPKSSYFYPKPSSGVFLRKLDREN